MPVNRNALIRYKTIDQCLQNRYRQWTLNDLIEACSDALYDYEGIDKGVSKRSIQADIQMMRSDKLGYNAPIVVVERKYYTYEDPDYSITNIPLTDQDLGRLSEAVEFLKQFKGFSHFSELDTTVQKLEDHVYARQTRQRTVIDFEKNEDLKGLENLDRIYQAIINRKSLLLTYQSFRARQPSSFTFHPYLLKEFRNRWFMLGMKGEGEPILNLALDRIQGIQSGTEPYLPNPDFDPDAHFAHAIGVSVTPTMPPEQVELFISAPHAPYVLTKPFHSSQRLIRKGPHGITIGLNVVHNFELERDILGFADGIKVLKPNRLRRAVEDRLRHALERYETGVNTTNLQKASQKLRQEGYGTLNKVYANREVQEIRKAIDRFKSESQAAEHGIRLLFQKLPELEALVLTPNLREILQLLMPDAFLVKALYLEKNAAANWLVNWHQDVPINVSEQLDLPGFSKWTFRESIHSVQPPLEISKGMLTIRIHLDDTRATDGALEVIPASHQQRHDDRAIEVLTENTVPKPIELEAGGIQLMRPLLLHRSARSQSERRRRVIHLEFANQELPGGLQWLERLELNAVES